MLVSYKAGVYAGITLRLNREESLGGRNNLKDPVFAGEELLNFCLLYPMLLFITCGRVTFSEGVGLAGIIVVRIRIAWALGRSGLGKGDNSLYKFEIALGRLQCRRALFTLIF